MSDFNEKINEYENVIVYLKSKENYIYMKL